MKNGIELNSVISDNVQKPKETSEIRPDSGKTSKFTIVFIIIALLIGKCLILLIFFYKDELISIMQSYKLSIKKNLTLSYVIYLIFSILSSLFFIPVSIVMITGGFILALYFEGKFYGYIIAVFLILLNTIISGLITFIFSKTFLRQFLREKVIMKFEKLKKLEILLIQKGAKIIFLIRLSPIVPLFLLNYIFGGFTISNTEYIIGGFGSFPITFLYVYIGYMTLNIETLVNSGVEYNYKLIYVLYNLLGAIIILIIFCIISKYSNEEFQKFMDEKKENSNITNDKV